MLTVAVMVGRVVLTAVLVHRAPWGKQVATGYTLTRSVEKRLLQGCQPIPNKMSKIDVKNERDLGKMSKILNQIY